MWNKPAVTYFKELSFMQLCFSTFPIWLLAYPPTHEIAYRPVFLTMPGSWPIIPSSPPSVLPSILPPIQPFTYSRKHPSISSMMQRVVSCGVLQPTPVDYCHFGSGDDLDSWMKLVWKRNEYGTCINCGEGLQSPIALISDSVPWCVHLLWCELHRVTH
jgi:hypothetical protein